MVPLRILHVEDDPDDAFFLYRAIKNARPDCELHLEKNGEGAIDYLRKAGVESKSVCHPRPDLMILDLKLPGLSGFEVLSWTRDKADFKSLPIVVLSGSSLAEDQQKASELGASEFIVKHSDYDQIAQQVIHFAANRDLPGSNAGRNLNDPSQS
jgi:two-component system response regulator